MRPIIGVFLVSAALLAIILVAPVVGQGNDDETEVPIVVGFDMNPTGNTCPNNCTDPGGLGYCTTCPTAPNCDCTLGSIDPCVEVPTGGGTIQFDVFLDGLPDGESLLGWSVVMGEKDDNTLGQVTAYVHKSGTVNLPAQPGSNILDLTAAAPRPLPGTKTDVADFGYAEYNPPFTKGVLGRYTANIAPAADGLYGLTMPLEYVKMGSEYACNLCTTGYVSPMCSGGPGCDIWDANADAWYGVIAVGVDCPTGPKPPPTPTPTASPTPPASSTPASPTPTSTPVPPHLAAGWNHVCYLEAELPISDALADLEAGALAVYRLQADQGFDKWFPNRLDISTITTVSPYEALFILMANDAAWPEQPAAAPPTGLDLAQGWNSACYSGQTEDVQSATASIAGQYDALYLSAPNQGWKRFIPARPDISGLTELQQFDAVLVLVTQPGGTRWVFD